MSAPASAGLIKSAESASDAGLMNLAPEATLTSVDTTDRTNLGPLPAPMSVDPSTSSPSTYVADPTLLNPNATSTAPAQAPQRRGILGGLFNSSKRKR